MARRSVGDHGSVDHHHHHDHGHELGASPEVARILRIAVLAVVAVAVGEDPNSSTLMVGFVTSCTRPMTS